MVMLPCMQGSLEAPLNDGVVHAVLQVLSLLVEEDIYLPLKVRQESWPNFKGITNGK